MTLESSLARNGERTYGLVHDDWPRLNWAAKSCWRRVAMCWTMGPASQNRETHVTSTTPRQQTWVRNLAHLPVRDGAMPWLPNETAQGHEGGNAGLQ